MAQYGTPQDETVSKAIKYKIQYRNDAGDPIKEEEQFKPWPKLVSDEDEEHTGSILDVVTYVTIREITFSKSVDSEAGAKVAGSESKDSKEQALTTDGSPQKADPAVTKSKALKSENLEITSIGETEMQIRSSALIKALRALVDYYPSQQLTGSIVTVPEPYHFLLHHRKELIQALEPETTNLRGSLIHERPDQKTVDHIQVLLAFLNSKYAKKIEEEERRHMNSPPTATFEMLWMLLKPGTKVYYEVEWELAAFVVKEVKPNRPSNPNFYTVELWSLDFDGQYIGRCRREVVVSSFSGERDVASLKIFPIEMASDQSVRQHLEKKGELYFNILRNGNQQFNYDGHTLGSKKRRHKGRVVLDPSSFWSYSKREIFPPEVDILDDDTGPESLGNCLCDDCEARRKMSRPSKWAGFEELDPKESELHLTAEHFILFPRKIPGFAIKSRTWEFFDINCVSNFEPNETAINNLVMNDSHLRMVKILTERYNDQDLRRDGAWSADFIQSKGEGQIFLLHGPPGVGKTYTAECIAETSRRPLLALTCADIGTDETRIESTLSSWFALAEIWGAVMLIDEADIYLEIRSTGDLQRSSLVSAFLRSMEYYRGILFLTTNRIGHIDDAIMSRVHLVVRYERLTPMARNKIWDQFVEKVMEERENVSVDKRATAHVKEFFEDPEIEWNGREIRNAIQTAVALAEYEAKTAKPPLETVKLKTTHIQEVIEMSQIFKRYLADFKGNEAKRAMEDRSRMDEDKKYKPGMAATLAEARQRNAKTS